MPIELDLTPEERRAQIIRNCGVKPCGERPLREGLESLAYFTDPITRSTLILPVEEVTEINVRKKLSASRFNYGLAVVEIAIRDNRELFEQLKSIFKFWESTRNMPENIIIAAANAAAMEFVAYKIANEPETTTQLQDHFSSIIDHSTLPSPEVPAKEFQMSDNIKPRPAFLRKLMD